MKPSQEVDNVSVNFIKSFVLVVVLGLGILLLPESISSSLNYSLDSLSSPSSSSSSNSTSSPTSNSSSFEENGDLTLEEGGSAESYSSGAAGGYAFTKPFNLNDASDVAAYIGSDGYLYTGGIGWGGSSSSNTSWTKQTSAGTNIVDYDIGQGGALIVNSTGQVKVASSGASSRTWSTVSVGGSATGSSNKAVAVSYGRASYQFVLMADGRLYVSEDGETSMSSLVFSASTSTSRGGIVDISGGEGYQYVLFGNGDLYGGTAGGTSMSRIATGVKMFDYNNRTNEKIVIYDGSMIKYASNAGSNTHTWSNLLSSNKTDVVQIRTSRNGWGFLTSSGTLYTMEGSATTAWTGTNHTRTETGVSYFDCSTTGTWGYLKSGQIYLWQTSSSSNITTNTSPSTSGLTNNSGLPTPDLGGLPSISSSPPAMNFRKRSK